MRYSNWAARFPFLCPKNLSLGKKKVESADYEYQVWSVYKFLSINWRKQNTRFQYEVPIQCTMCCLYCAILFSCTIHACNILLCVRYHPRRCQGVLAPTTLPLQVHYCVQKSTRLLKLMHLYDTRRVPGGCQGKK